MPGNQASGVPRQDRRRARLESEDGTDQSAATHIRVEEARRPQWTMSSSVEDILLEGSTNRTDMKLNDFLRSNLGGRGVVDTNENVTMQEFVQDPEMFLKNEILLRTIKTTDAYLSIEGVVREEMDKVEDVSKLKQAGVYNLQKWSEAAAQVKESVHEITKSFLDAALQEANKPTMTSAPIYLEGYYESVYNASWHHVE
ncbi:putative retrotransposon hot spot protein (RHS,) [Trypanosoma cruzi]|uniref:Putative retrotransposon hot spot protein (RHS,) n=1 Tax=Trypanosoma cruzi TaxID=5693 RepID=A0A2V2VHE0_TRYCR|nr:putative retrotransposon hot spot protein (RHS,) [Trypanosoma cruzi]